MSFQKGNKLGKKFQKNNKLGKRFVKGEKHPWSHKGRVLSEDHRRKLSESKKGERNHNWQGGITDVNYTLRNNIDYRLWREAVFKRDGFTCKQCGDDRGRNLNAHHIKPFSLFPELRFAIDNGVTLCVTCHRKTDTFGGRKAYKPKK
jgi:5-methylcytosine-specific restriction endonuclease McrA